MLNVCSKAIAKGKVAAEMFADVYDSLFRLMPETGIPPFNIPITIAKIRLLLINNNVNVNHFYSFNFDNCGTNNINSKFYFRIVANDKY